MFTHSQKINDNRFVFEDIQKALKYNHVHDVLLRVGTRTFTADRYVLFARSPYWRKIIPQKDSQSYTLDELQWDSVRTLLEYIYYGKVTLHKKLEDIFHHLVAAHYFEMTKLFSELVNIMSDALTKDNIFDVYVKSHKNEITELTDICLSYIDSYSLDFYTTTEFSQLPLEPLRTILDRSTFFAPEYSLLSLVAHYLSAYPPSSHHSLFTCIRFKLIEPEEINAIMEQHKWLTADAIDIYKSETRNKYRECHVKYTNLVAKHLRPVVVSASLSNVETKDELTIAYDSKKRRLQMTEDHSLEYLVKNYNRCEIVLKLLVPCRTNLLLISLKNQAPLLQSQSGEFSFIVKVSHNGVIWSTVADRTEDCCQGWQKVCFSPVTIRFVKIVGVNWTPDQKTHFFWSWILYLQHCFKLGNIRCYNDSYRYTMLGSYFKPNYNVATNHWGVVVYENGKKLSTTTVFDENVKVSEKKETVSIRSGQFIDIALSQLFFVDSMRFMIANIDNDVYDLKVHIWHNHEEIWYDLEEHDFGSKHPPTSQKWKCVQTLKGVKGWQSVDFPLQKVATVSLECTAICSRTTKAQFSILHFELPSQEHA